MIVDGTRWWTTAQACAQLRVSAGLIRVWAWRSRRLGHVPEAGPAECPRCVADPDGFPHIDPAVRRGRVAGYRAEQLLAAEAYTSRRARPAA